MLAWLGNITIGILIALSINITFVNRDDPVAASVAAIGGGIMIVSSFTAPVNITFGVVTSVMIFLSGVVYARAGGSVAVPIIAAVGVALGTVLVFFPTLVGGAIVALSAIGVFVSVEYHIAISSGNRTPVESQRDRGNSSQ